MSTQSTQAIVRQQLEAKLAELVQRAARIDAHQHERDRDVPKDWDDLAQYRENDEVVDRLDDLTRDEIARLRATLERMDLGTWGTCARCSGEIEPARLQAAPTAPTCLACARALETRPG